ncbi:unnamed protein product [Clonostachys rosea f. rosea IK726]|uniref:STAS domain-containing protein n=2 Tax=Bionectria ochroleuca TaxID=29856 RepID=A0A0B7JQ59_BIOOC|nr:unnamed protein product [Clonostachys rosea f. rosea IK726]
MALPKTGPPEPEDRVAGDTVSQLASSPDMYIEGLPTSVEWLREQLPSAGEAASYTVSLFPFVSWVSHYNNIQWLASDVVAGVTIGAVVVPQGMAYALLAKLPPEYGLYSSFVGVMLYWIFGTSKDISIGPVAVLSTVVGNVIEAVRISGLDTPPQTIAFTLSVVSGSIVLAIGLLRWGWIVDIIPLTSLSAFMTGSAVTIAASQLPALLGVKGFSNRDPPYQVILNTVKHLAEAKTDAVLGITALIILYSIRHSLAKAAERFPRHKRFIFFLSTMRTVAVLVMFTTASYLINADRPKDPLFDILGHIPQGFRHIGVPQVDFSLVHRFSSLIPATVIVMVVEHMAIAKSFGRVNNYTIDPSQEMVAIGITNMLGPVFGGYSSTGSFSRTAINSKAGVRTPAAGLFTGGIVLLATYFLTEIFFFIPSAALAAVIIHAVGDLVTSPSTATQFWRVSPIEFFVFVVGVLVSFFAGIEDGLYTTIGLSIAILLFRLLQARGDFLGRVKVHSVLGDHIIGDSHREVVAQYGTFDQDTTENSARARNVYLPLNHGDGSNPELNIETPYPGIFIYRFSDGFNFTNANASLDYLTEFIYDNTKQTSPVFFERPGDRPWNDPGPRRSAKSLANPLHDRLPCLKAIILDFSSVNNVDITSVQRLIDVRNQLDAYSTPDVVDWHIACINNRWTKRALDAAGFGVPSNHNEETHHRWKSIFSIADIGGRNSAAAVAEESRMSSFALRNEEEASSIEGLSPLAEREGDIGMEKTGAASPRRNRGVGGGLAIHSVNKPLFHVDLTSALQSAIANVEAKEEFKFSQQLET